MKYLIVAIYDSGYGLSINVNGKNFDRDNYDSATWEALEDPMFDKKLFSRYKAICTRYDKPIFTDWLKTEYKDFDLIVIVENSRIELLKKPQGDYWKV